jgi:hypothetical protein
MNYKIAKTMLVLCVVYLIGFYILKFIFPELLLQTITSPTMLKLGDFVAKWKGFEVIINCICTLITYYLFSCASTGSFKRTKFEIAVLIIAVLFTAIIFYFLPNFYTHTSTATILIVCSLCKGTIGKLTLSFSLHGFLSHFLTEIRGFENVIIKVAQTGVVGGILLALEGYVWLILLSLLFYFKEKKDGNVSSSVYK